MPAYDYDKGGRLFIRFDGWEDFIETAESGSAPRFRKRERPSHQYSYGGWAGTETFADAVKMARDGWPRGLEGLRKLSGECFDNLVTRCIVDRPRYDVEGNFFDVARVIEGEPECWTRFDQELENTGSKYVSILFNCAVSGGIGTDVILARGAALTALIELLEFTGRRVDLTVCCGLKIDPYRDTVTEIYVPVKRSDQPLDMNRIAFALMSPAMLRRMVFSILEQQDPAHSNLHNLGYPSDVHDEDPFDMYFSKGMLGEPSWRSTSAAESWIVERLKSFGVDLKDAVPAGE